MTVYDFLINCFTNDIDNLVSFIVALSNSGEYTCCFCQFYYEWLKSYDIDFLSNNDFHNYCKYDCERGVKKWLQSNNKEYRDEIAKEIHFEKSEE